jgi:uncharacterized protein with NRDE domain
MCTIVALKGVRADLPLILATNRDEFFARPSSGPERLLDAPPTLGGRDLVAGGTWMGVTREGLFVGVTNQRTFAAPDTTRRSRGQLVLEALGLDDVDAVTRHVRSLDGRAYNPFNLMWGNARGLWVAYAREGERALVIEEVRDGLHVLPNDRLDSPSFAKVARARELIAPHVHAPVEVLLRSLQTTLGDRRLPPLAEIPGPPATARMSHARLRELAALCVRSEGYGTRTSTVVGIAPHGTAHFLYADGPPDQTPFVDIMSLF